MSRAQVRKFVSVVAIIAGSIMLTIALMLASKYSGLTDTVVQDSQNIGQEEDEPTAQQSALEVPVNTTPQDPDSILESLGIEVPENVDPTIGEIPEESIPTEDGAPAPTQAIESTLGGG